MNKNLTNALSIIRKSVRNQCEFITNRIIHFRDFEDLNSVRQPLKIIGKTYTLVLRRKDEYLFFYFNDENDQPIYDVNSSRKITKEVIVLQHEHSEQILDKVEDYVGNLLKNF